MIEIVIDEKELHKAYRQFNTLVSAKSQGRVMSSSRAAGARYIATRVRKTKAFRDRKGVLRASIKANKLEPFWKGYWEIRAGAAHAYNVEHGHQGLKDNRGAKPHPFLLPGAKAAGGEAFRRSGRAFWKAVKRELAKGN